MFGKEKEGKMRSLKIGDIILENCLLMAPMAGITDPAFRALIRRMGASLVFTEMISSVGLVKGDKKTRRYLFTESSQRPVAFQISGSDPKTMAEAAIICQESGADLVDINMGCPAKKVVKKGAGATLLGDPLRVYKIVSEVKKAISIPLTCKIRAGWNSSKCGIRDVAKAIEDGGADAITIHARYADWDFSRSADWSHISSVKATVDIPVIGNGDIFSVEDIFKMKEKTKCDGVMIARGALRDPWIFKKAIDLKASGRYIEPNIEEKGRLFFEYVKTLRRFYNERGLLLRSKRILFMITKGSSGARRFRERISHIEDMEQLLEIFNNYLSELKRDNKE